MADDTGKVVKTDAEWREILDPEAYRVMRQHGTERPGSHDDFPDTAGTFHCKGCGAELFESETKFDAHCGWPSFYQTAEDAPVGETTDRSHFMVRTEVHCDRCGALHRGTTRVRESPSHPPADGARSAAAPRTMPWRLFPAAQAPHGCESLRPRRLP